MFSVYFETKKTAVAADCIVKCQITTYYLLRKNFIPELGAEKQKTI